MFDLLVFRKDDVRQIGGLHQVQGRKREHRYSTCCVLQVCIVVQTSVLPLMVIRTCFDSLVIGKFRRSLDPHVQPCANDRRKHHLKASGNLLVGFSGGLGSSVALDVCNRCYFSPDSDPQEDESVKGGKAHPRKKRMWKKAFVCYIDQSAALPGVSDRPDMLSATFPTVRFADNQQYRGSAGSC